jgi:hypothetical protein
VQQVVRRPGVTVEDVEAVLQVHADRVHDAVRRLGVDGETAVDVVERSGVALVDAVASRPEDVPDAVGWWFAEARRLSGGAAPELPDLPIGGGVLSVDDDQLVLAEVLEELPEDERVALLLRDAYRLPMASVAAALGTDEPVAMSTVARARLHAVPLLDEEPAPAVPSHAESLSSLARLGEAGQVEPRDATVRRHVQACLACTAVTEAQQRVHLLLSGLAVVALPAEVRPAVLRRVEGRARAVLPAASSLALTEEELEDWEDDDRHVLSPLLATLAVLLALLVGTGLGVLLSRGADAVLPTSSGVLPAVTLPPWEPPPPLTLPADLPPPPPIPTPRTTVYYLAPKTTPPAPRPTTPTPTPQATTAAPTPTPAPDSASLAVDPATGPDGATLQVTGAGWTPGSRVTLDYLDPAGQPLGSSAQVTVGDDGTFAGELVARNPAGVPGRHTVRAGDGSRTRTAPYDATA